MEIFEDGVGGTINGCNVKRGTRRKRGEDHPQLTAITFDHRGMLWNPSNPGAR